MVGTNAPTPAQQKRATKQRRQRKPESESAPAVNYLKNEKDVAKLIGCLAEWTRDLHAARSVVPEPPVRKSRSSSKARRTVPTVSLARFYPRGNPLTESMEFRDRDGVAWLVYIEGQRVPTGELGSVTVLPGRSLRFDSATESRFASFVPAGSPFLAEPRLQLLLDEAGPDLPSRSTPSSPVSASRIRRHRASRWSTRAVESSREAMAYKSLRWQQVAKRSKSLRHQGVELLSSVAHSMRAMMELLLGRRPARS